MRVCKTCSSGLQRFICTEYEQFSMIMGYGYGMGGRWARLPLISSNGWAHVH